MTALTSHPSMEVGSANSLSMDSMAQIDTSRSEILSLTSIWSYKDRTFRKEQLSHSGPELEIPHGNGTLAMQPIQT